MKFSIALALFILFVPGIRNLSAEEKFYNTKPYDFVASEIMQNKIVMLGENGAINHYNLFPHITFINVIKNWYSKLKKENLRNKTLTLIIEKSPSAVKLIQHYIDNGDLDPFVSKHGDTYSLEDLYLYYKLRELNREIKESSNQLKIAGFEIDERYDDEYFFKTSAEERSTFYGRDRDSLLFENISSYIKKNPGENILINYGGIHLDEEYDQRTSPSGNYDGKGYFLGYYLRREFGKRFVTVDQTFIPDEEFKYSDDIAYLKNKNFIVQKGDTLFAGRIPFSALRADYTILRHDGLIGPHFIRNVFSASSLARNYNKLLRFENLSAKYNSPFSLKPADINNPLVSLTLESIKLITGKEFESIKDYKSYLDSTENHFYHDRISKEEFSNELLARLKTNPDDRQYKYMLFSLGMTVWIYWGHGVPTEEVWKNDLWKNTLPHMNYFDYVGLYWLGNASEKQRAKKFLTEFTKQDFTHAAEYLEWYYKNKFNYKLDPV